MIGGILLALALLTTGPAWAAPAPPDPAGERRAAELSEQLRCLVCQNQTIADSNAELAVDLRRQIKEQIGAGKSDPEIIDFMVQRYGDFVLYRPPVKPATLLLWFGPLLLLAIGAAVLARNLLRRRGETRPLSAEEQARARALLGEGGGREGP